MAVRFAGKFVADWVLAGFDLTTAVAARAVDLDGAVAAAVGLAVVDRELVRERAPFFPTDTFDTPRVTDDFVTKRTVGTGEAAPVRRGLGRKAPVEVATQGFAFAERFLAYASTFSNHFPFISLFRCGHLLLPDDIFGD